MEVWEGLFSFPILPHIAKEHLFLQNGFTWLL